MRFSLSSKGLEWSALGVVAMAMLIACGDGGENYPTNDGEGGDEADDGDNADSEDGQDDPDGGEGSGENDGSADDSAGDPDGDDSGGDSGEDDDSGGDDGGDSGEDDDSGGDDGGDSGEDDDSGGDDGGDDCEFPPVDDLDSPGPFTVVSTDEGPACTIFRPQTLGEACPRHPVILWGNGTGGFVSVYSEAFNLWASHGFIVAAAQTGTAGSGADMLACLDYLHTEDSTSGSEFEGRIDLARAGASGHSQGGGGALMSGQDPRITTTAPLQPYIEQGFGNFDRASIANQRGPMLLQSGTADTIAAPETHQRPVFEMTNVPVFWANLIGGDHVSVSFGIPTYRQIMLGWFRLQLMGDEAFRDMFYGPDCGLCTDDAWDVDQMGL